MSQTITFPKSPEPVVVTFDSIPSGWFTAAFSKMEEPGLYFKHGVALFRVDSAYMAPYQVNNSHSTRIHNYTPVDVEIVVKGK